jgi:hypothetical protein
MPDPVIEPPEEELPDFDLISEHEAGAFEWCDDQPEPPLLL